MISFLQGIVAAHHPDRLEVDVNGVGYEVFTSQKTLQAAPTRGQSILLKTYLHVREDTQQLFGFLRDDEKQAFLLALSVSGVGPKAALSVLSTLAPGDFYQAILRNDLSLLKSIPGIGNKSAQHLVLELKDKVTKLAGGSVFTREGALSPESRNLADAIQALVSLGYSPSESRQAALGASQALGEKTTVEEILKFSLKSIAAP